jgi:hypothetical protein
MKRKRMSLLWLVIPGLLLGWVVAGFLTPGGVSRLWLQLTKSSASNAAGKLGEQLRTIAAETAEAIPDEQVES